MICRSHLFELDDEDENNILKYLVSIPSTFENGDPDLEANLISENLNAQHIGIDFEFKQVSNILLIDTVNTIEFLF